MKLEVTTPDEYMGSVNGTIAQRRGRVDSMDERGGNKIVKGLFLSVKCLGIQTPCVHSHRDVPASRWNLNIMKRFLLISLPKSLPSDAKKEKLSNLLARLR